uniref:Apple domain-containing protein n=1 Tax=Plectus sambesii TaxID=2011161 RepID=A0A914W3X5_9BILA
MSITSTIPPTQSSCSIVGVDPRVHLSSRPRNFKVYPNVEDCAAKCAAETNFTCKGFVWMGSKSGCVLHGKIDSPVIMQKNSRWFLIDLNCATVSPCYWPAKATNIDPTTISASKKAVNVQIHDHCQALCLLGVLQPACWAYAHSTDSAVTSGYNCYLFPALTQSQSNAAASGKFSLYQNQCKM